MSEIKNISTKRLILIVLCLVVILSVFITFLVVRTKTNKKYRKMNELLNSGEYSEAGILLDELGNFKDSGLIRKQIVYEPLAFECIKELQKTLSSSSSYFLIDVEFHSEKGAKSHMPSCILTFEEIDKEGIDTINTALFIYEYKTHKYMHYGTTEINEDNLPLETKDYINKSLLILAIKYTRLNGTKVGYVSMERLQRLFNFSIQ